jgi:DNA-directed RNA polymerase subunit alpha
MNYQEILTFAQSDDETIELSSVEDKATFVIDAVRDELISRRIKLAEELAEIDSILEAREIAIPEPNTETLHLSVREIGIRSMGANALYRAGIITVADLCEKTPRQLRNINRFGNGSYKEIVSALGALGLSLKEPKSSF